MSEPAVPRLHVIVDVSPPAPDVGLVSTCAAAGARIVQLRAKRLLDRELHDVAADAVARAHADGARLLVNDRADVCVACGADGVHGGADDLPTAALRSVVGPARLVGGTARDARTAKAHEAAGADYVGVGPVYATTSKAGLPDPLGPAVVEEVAAAVSIPVVAISGITVERVPEVLAAGAHGVAVIGAIARAADPGAETRRFLDALGSS